MRLFLKKHIRSRTFKTTLKAVEKHRVYYHVTNVKNVPQIKRGGLKANEEGFIFVFTDMIVAETIATQQCFLMDQYAVFVIHSKGITGKVIMDRVAEYSAPYQRIIIQKEIPKRYIDFLASFVINHDEPTEWDLLVIKCTEGLSEAAAKKVFYKKKELIRNFYKERRGD